MPPGNIEILAYEDTPLGVLCLRRRELLGAPGTFVTEITLNHEFLMSSLNTASERALAELAIETHGGDELMVYIGGLGLGYTLQAALTDERVGFVDVTELLQPVIDWLEGGLVPLSEELSSGARFATHLGDAYEQLLSPPEKAWDCILIDIDHSPDDRLGRASDRFYTEAGIAATKRCLRPGGVLAVWSYEESSPFADAMRASFETVRIEPVTFENLLIDQEQTDWIFIGRDGPS